MFKLAKEIQETFGYSDTEMARQLKMRVHHTAWKHFMASKDVSSRRSLFHLWKMSGLTAKQFMERMGEEIKV